MLITHKLSLDLMHPDTPERIYVKQGDTMSRALEIQLFSDGEPWLIPADVTPLVRWFACDQDTGASTQGIYDTLPNGSNAWNYAQNQLDLILTPQMFTLPGLVQADVAMVQGEKVLSTFNFEFYVNPAPADGTEPEAQSYYKVSTLDQLNAELARLEDLIAIHRREADELFTEILSRITALEEA